MNSKLTVQAQEQISAVEQLFSEITELQQNRSNFALEKFVVGQHDMPARQRKQVLDELVSMMLGLQQSVTAHEMLQIDIEELSTKKERNKYEQKRNEIRIREKIREIRFIELQIIGTLRECNFLRVMLEQMPKYTREEYEQEEAEYWKRRLTRQVFLSDRGGMNYGNLDAVIQLFNEPGKPAAFTMPVNLKDILTGLIGINKGAQQLENVQVKVDTQG